MQINLEKNQFHDDIFRFFYFTFILYFVLLFFSFIFSFLSNINLAF